MDLRIWQCCYTNAGHEVDGVIRSGWQQVAILGDVPDDAKEACRRLQAANSHISTILTGENEEPLDILEFVGDSKNLYIIESKYNCVDRLGRHNMFSHAFVLPWENTTKSVETENPLCNPNLFLTLSGSNFKGTEEEASEIRLDDLQREAEFTPEQIPDLFGGKAENYYTAISQVYAQCINKTPLGPLYVKYDGTRRHMMALLYAIYSGLPTYARKHLSVASDPKGVCADKRLVVFTTHIENYTDLYLIPETGECSPLSESYGKKIAGLDFLKDGCFYKNPNELFVNLYSLVKRAEGVKKEPEEKDVKVAYDFFRFKMAQKNKEQIEEQAVLQYTNNAIRYGLFGKNNYVEYVKHLLEEVNRNGITISDDYYNALLQQISNNPIEQIVEIVVEYASKHGKPTDTIGKKPEDSESEEEDTKQNTEELPGNVNEFEEKVEKKKKGLFNLFKRKQE